MMKEMEGKVSPGATLIMMGLDNGMYYGEQEDGRRALPKQGEDKKFHVEGRVEVGTRKQAKGLLGHCLPILDRYEKNRKVLLSPSVRWYRRSVVIVRTTAPISALRDTGRVCWRTWAR
jgi:hypothetical protein